MTIYELEEVTLRKNDEQSHEIKDQIRFLIKKKNIHIQY